METITMDLLLQKQAENFSDRQFLFFQATGEVFTYQEFNDMSINVANLLLEMGVTKGDKVGVLLPNSIEFLAAYFGAIRAGAVVVPLNPSLKDLEIINILLHSNAKVLISNLPVLNGIRRMDQSSSELKHLLRADQLRDGIKRNHTMSTKAPEIMPEDPALILYTSGTTGDPKGVVLTHWNLISNATDIATALNLGSDRIMCILPLHHTNGQIINVLSPLISGGSVVLCDAYNALSLPTFWESIEKYEVNVIDMVPTVLTMLLRLRSKRKTSLDSLKYIICGAAPLTLELQKQFEERFNCLVIQEYGLTEGTCVSTINSLSNNKRGSIGLPLKSNRIKIANDQGVEVNVGEIGEILIRGDNVMKGYFKRPDLTNQIIINGWLHTGDLGKTDQDGYVYILGRKKDIIIKGGENIYPIDLENVIGGHPSVSECVVVGIPDEIYGENVKAYIVLKEGQVNVTPKNILSFCKGKLPLFWCPAIIEIVKFIPRTASGKVIKRALNP